MFFVYVTILFISHKKLWSNVKEQSREPRFYGKSKECNPGTKTTHEKQPHTQQRIYMLNNQNNTK